MAVQIGFLSNIFAVFTANSTPKISQNRNFLYSNLRNHTLGNLSTTPLDFSLKNGRKNRNHFISKVSASFSAGSVGEYLVDPATKVKFPGFIDLPGCSTSLSLLGMGYREKVFAIIGIKVYAAGLYINPAMLTDLNPWKGKSSSEIEQDVSVFQTIYQSSFENCLRISLVRDIDGKTFWDALDEAVSPRVPSPTNLDVTALSTFRSIFQGRSLKKGTLILLTWLEPSKMLVSVSDDGIPAEIDATIISMNVTKALFDVFFGESPVSPSLKTSAATGLANVLQ